jgi:uncharacterized membrane protein
MNAKESKRVRILAILFIVIGVLGLIYHGFTYTRETHEGYVGSMELMVNERHTVTIPAGASVGAIVIGTALLLFGYRER